jgi:hypothetical protein
MPRVAVLERVGSNGSAPWIRVVGWLERTDLPQLVELVDAVRLEPVTVDIRGLIELTTEGCDVLRELAGHLVKDGRRLTVLCPHDGALTDVLAVTGTLEDVRIDFAETALPP